MFREEAWFLYKMLKEFCETVSSQKESRAKHVKCEEVISSTFSVLIIFFKMSVKRDTCVAGFTG